MDQTESRATRARLFLWAGFGWGDIPPGAFFNDCFEYKSRLALRRP
jgi:hypothetical protein